MAIKVDVYDESNNKSQSVTVDFAFDILAASNAASIDSRGEYYLKFTTNAKETNGKKLPTKTATALSSLSLRGVKQSANNSSNNYSNITALVQDYLYDYTKGHTANQFGSGVTEQKPMKFN